MQDERRLLEGVKWCVGYTRKILPEGEAGASQKKGVDKENARGGVKVQIAFRRWSDVRKKCYDSNWFSTHPAGVEYMSRAI